MDACLANPDCCDISGCCDISDSETYDVNYVDFHQSHELWNAALDEEAELLTNNVTGSKTLIFTTDTEAPLLFQLVREACN